MADMDLGVAIDRLRPGAKYFRYGNYTELSTTWADETSLPTEQELIDEWAVYEREQSAIAHKAKRLAEYPSFGDLFDSLAKKEAGNSTEWDALMVARAAVKTKYTKS